MSQVYPFTTDEVPDLAQVGGKGLSLIRMTRHGLPVPPGFVLAVDFFEPWLESIRSTREWTQVLSSSPDDLKENSDVLKMLCVALDLDEWQKSVLAKALEPLSARDGTSLFAVRSSSPEEDLEGASFAGGYETVLGVQVDGVENALRRSFASCLDERVFVYKREHGFDVNQPRVAVIVQRQITSEIAGVAFSLNPINNCYDEAVINANYGLGESVVSGMISPDSFTVDKVSRTILERKIGTKETSIWLTPDGGTYKEPSPSRSELCLTDNEVLALTDLLVTVEDAYRMPIDIEWAFAEGKLYLLQARPITAYFPLPEVMLTALGEQKRLYADLTLIKWGMQEPLSVMGTDYLAIINQQMLKATMGEDIGPDVINAVRITVAGRTYVDNTFTLKTRGKAGVADFARAMDTLSAEIITGIDEAEYIPDKLPPALRGILFKMIRQNLGLVGGVLRALKNPDEYKQKYFDEEERLRKSLKVGPGLRLSAEGYATDTMNMMLTYARAFAPGMAAAELARSRIKKLFEGEESAIRDQVALLERALPNNITIEMGLSMYRLAGFGEITGCPTGEVFASRLRERSLSHEFLEAWDAFMEMYGFRAPMEMDPAAPRYYERPAEFFEQLKTMAENTDASSNPQAIFDRARAQREQAYNDLLWVAQRRGGRKARQFEKNYRILMELGGLRERPKYFVSLIADMFRRYALTAAQPLVEAGRLDSPEQVFDLTMSDLDRGLSDPSLDLRALAGNNTRYERRLQHIRELPRVVDSRGKILRPPKKETGEGELVGEPISAGTVQGMVKVLLRPDEKPVLPGEILVARATDPGWTPLFLNAGGIILEVGGMLQHGALVAREYGKPCVTGIEQATSVLCDGQMVEVDGLNGIVRLLQ